MLHVLYRVFAAIVFGTMAVGQATAFAPDYNKAKLAAARVFQQLDVVPSIDSASTDGKKLEEVKGAVTFKDIEFSYPSRPTVKVLKNFQLEIEPGQKVALVGSSGSGKSTVVSLLERFYDPAYGSMVCTTLRVHSH
jgi:ABC-type multidrug transport system fused ATPase/permease subunit